jgi:hypothetical protein
MCSKGENSTFDYITVLVGGGSIVNTTGNINSDNLITDNTQIQDNIIVDNVENDTADNSNQNNNGTAKSTVAKIDPKVFYKPMEKYINNSVKLDSEVLPVEVVRGDPIKINIINIPQDIRDILISQ